MNRPCLQLGECKPLLIHKLVFLQNLFSCRLIQVNREEKKDGRFPKASTHSKLPWAIQPIRELISNFGAAHLSPVDLYFCRSIYIFVYRELLTLSMIKRHVIGSLKAQPINRRFSFLFLSRMTHITEATQKTASSSELHNFEKYAKTEHMHTQYIFQ